MFDIRTVLMIETWVCSACHILTPAELSLSTYDPLLHLCAGEKRDEGEAAPAARHAKTNHH